jgi:selT/selW/selH-like putative selenoprotein
LSAELVTEFPDIEIELFAEGKGIFDVIADGVPVFSKYEVHRFPESGEITGHLKN